MQTESNSNAYSKTFLKYLISGKKLEICVLILFVVSHIIVTIFHEPWFDEAQAWQIARCASLKDIIFTIPHYEGHPALWHLILMFPAKLGLPYELSLKTIQGIFISLCVLLVEFKAPFARWFKLLLPFTFFFFYQYGIIARPYSMLLLFVIMAALFFKSKNERPFRFVLSLMLMCCTSAFGILIAGGIAIGWVIEIVLEKPFKDTLKSLFTTKRMISLWALLLFACVVCYQILPKVDTFATNTDVKNSFAERIICTFFGFIPDTFLTENIWSSGESFLADVNFDIGALIITALLGIFIWFLIWFFSGKRKFIYFLATYSLFALFSAAVYFSAHHIGIVLFIVMFWAWINFEDDDCYYKLNSVVKKITSKYGDIKWVQTLSDKDVKKSIRGLITAIEFIVVCLSIYWSIGSSVLDIKVQYSYGRETAKFIKDHHLDELSMLAEWGYLDSDKTDGSYVNNVYYMHIPVNFYPYFDDEIVENMEYGYVIHKNADENTSNQVIESWKSIGKPDVLLGYVDLASLYDCEISRIDYSPVYKFETNIIWRGSEYITYNYIFVRNDLLDEYGLSSLYDSISVSE